MKLSAKAGDRVYDIDIEHKDARFRVRVDGVEHLVDARKLEADFYSFLMEGRSYEVAIEPEGSVYYVRHGASQRDVILTDPTRCAREDLRASGTGPEIVVSIMPGKVVRVLVEPGDSVAVGEGLVVVEAMKMENEIVAPRAGRIAAVNVEAGRTVEAGAALVVIE